MYNAHKYNTVQYNGGVGRYKRFFTVALHARDLVVQLPQRTFFVLFHIRSKIITLFRKESEI